MTLAIEKLAVETGRALKKRDLILSTAESCTGGGLSYWITSVPGSSDWFDRGFVVYSNAAKSDLLDVDPATIDQFGAVSEQTVREMAEGALKKSLANISIAITGIAGPKSELPSKPVGSLWMAFARRDLPTEVAFDIFHGDRQHIRMRAMECVLEKLLLMIQAP
jgi:nicotinamide-nucleotide amidase